VIRNKFLRKKVTFRFYNQKLIFDLQIAQFTKDKPNQDFSYLWGAG